MKAIAIAGLLTTAAAFSIGLSAKGEEPEWVKQPSSADYHAAWPDEALKLSAGTATLHCKTDVSGALSDCSVARESPDNFGFGSAPLKLAPQFRLKQNPASDSIDFDVRFKASDHPVIVNPDWLHKPTSDELRGVWPTKALQQGINGKAFIVCKVSLEGALFDCQVESEEPAGMGFGAAAIALTPQFLFKPRLRDGRATVTTVRFPVNWAGLTPGSAASSDGQRVLQNVTWLEAPSYSQVAAAYPKKAANDGTEGHAALDCRIASDQRLHDCNVITEQPKGMGFGKAARDLAPLFRAPAMTSAGQSTKDAHVDLGFTFVHAMLAASPRIGQAQWVALPSGEEFDKAFPHPKDPISIHVMLDCRIGPTGHLEDCQLQNEAPAGQGLGAASLALAPSFVLALWSAEGLPTVGGRVRVPITVDIK